MKFGLLYDFRNPPPWQVPFPELYSETFDQIRTVEALGFDSVWVTEHHFIDDGYLPSCLPAAAAIAQITSRVKIGMAVLLLPLHNALQVAEDAAVVDIISNGRLIFGAAAGYKLDEFAAFGVKRGHRPSLMEESLEVITRCWTEDSFSFEGRHYNLKNIRMTPKPVQKPRPQIVMGARAKAPALRAARLADGIIGPEDPALIAEYLAAAEASGRSPSQCTVAVLRMSVISEDPEKMRAEIAPHVRWRNTGYGAWYAEAADLPQDRQMLEMTEEMAKLMIRDPQTEIRELKSLQSMGVNHVLYFATWPGYPPSKMLPTWEAFAKKVIPLFRSKS